MPLLPIKIPPGIVKQNSPNAAQGRYTDCDKFRFNGNFPEKWGGWTSFASTTAAIIGVPRGALSWANVIGTQNLAFGSAYKLYTITDGGEVINDITPIRASGTLGSDPFSVSTSTASSTAPGNRVTVTDSSHGVIVGAYVTLVSSTSVGGILISGEYQVETVIDANTYTILAASTSGPTTTTNGGGANVTYEYQINPGFTNPGYGTGWGMSVWGSTYGWGVPVSTGGLPVDMRHWSLAEYGNNLLAVPFADTLYDWEEDVDTRAQVVTNAPDYIRSMFVTPERFVFALGASTGSPITPMKVMWPDQDDITDWTPSVSNNANSRTLQNGSKLVAGAPFQQGISLVWSDTALYVFQYTGSDLVYDSRLAGDHCGLIGPLAHVNVDGVAYWMSAHDFHLFNGSVVSIPNAEDITDYVFGHMHEDLRQKTACTYFPVPDTIVWDYVSVDSTDFEPDRYVEVALGNYAWSFGTLRRTCGIVYRPHEGSVVMADPAGRLWLHEDGNDDNISAMEAYITYGLYSVSEGDQNVDIVGFRPDFTRQTGQAEVDLFTKEYPNSLTTFDRQTVIFDEGDAIKDCRVSGRHFGFTIRTNDLGADLRIGVPALEMPPGSAGERR